MTDNLRDQLNEAYRVLNQDVRVTGREQSEGLKTVPSMETDRRSSGNIIPASKSQVTQQASEQTKTENKGKASTSEGNHKGVKKKDLTQARNKKTSKMNSNGNNKKRDKMKKQVTSEIVRPPSIVSNHFANENGIFEYPAEDENSKIALAEDFSPRVDGTNMPEKNLSLSRVYGYQSNSHTGNLICLSSSEVAYTVGSIIVLWSSRTKQQRFYTGHTRDIDCLTSYEGNIVASVQTLFVKEENHHIKVNIWSVDTLETITTFREPLGDQNLIGIYFGANGMLLILKGSPESVSGRIWDWKSPRKKVSTAFHVS